MKEAILRIYKENYRGKENAITRKAFYSNHCFSHCWGLPSPSDRNFRRIYSQLPIVTCNKGGFYPTKPSEIEEFREYMWKKAIPHFERFNRVRNAHPELAKDIKQLELFAR